jgi:uncharacterized membrane protein YoaK (UPF0700 family)
MGRLSINLASQDFGAGIFALILVTSFFGGAFFSALQVENLANDLRKGYGHALIAEAGLLWAFVFVAGVARTNNNLLLDAQAALLCAAMGVQNALVTRLSGAVIRTTHLTGVTTDLGIEAARWYRWHRAKLKSYVPIMPNFLPGDAVAEKPTAVRTYLLLTLVLSFMGGAIAGAIATVHISRWAIAVPATAILALALLTLYVMPDDTATKTEA